MRFGERDYSVHLFVMYDNMLTAFVSAIKPIVKAYGPLRSYLFYLDH